MTQDNNITGENIISSLKTLGFTESTEKSTTANQINFVNKEHKISVSSGTLDANETTRMRTELGPIFKAFDSNVKASEDKTLLSVRDWLACAEPGCKK